VARGWFVAAEIAGIPELLDGIKRNEDRIPAEQEYRWLTATEGVLNRTVRWAVENLPEETEVGGVIERFKAPVAELRDILPSIVAGSLQSALEDSLEELKGGGVPSEAAQRVAALQFLGELMAVTRISQEVDVSVGDVGHAYFALADEVDFSLLIELLKMTPGEDTWEQRAAQGLLQDLGQARRDLTLAVLNIEGATMDERLANLRERHAGRLTSMREVLEELMLSENINVSALTVATREIVRHSRAILKGKV
jgi:glutamate dehydrogenase